MGGRIGQGGEEVDDLVRKGEEGGIGGRFEGKTLVCWGQLNPHKVSKAKPNLWHYKVPDSEPVSL